MATTTTADLIDAVGEEARLDITTLSPDRARLLRWLKAGASIIAAEAEAVHKYVPSEFSLAPASDTIGVTNNDNEITGVSADITGSVAPGDELLIDGVSYTVGLRTSTSTIDLTSNYAGSTGSATLVVPSRYRFDISAIDLLEMFDGFIKIDSVKITDSAGTESILRQVTMEDLEAIRQGPALAESTPQVYAVDYPILAVYPTPATGTTATVQTIVELPAFTDDATEITFIPEVFIVGALTDYMMYRALRFKKDANARQYLEEFQSNRVTGMPAIRRHFARIGGRQLPGAL